MHHHIQTCSPSCPRLSITAAPTSCCRTAYCGWHPLFPPAPASCLLPLHPHLRPPSLLPCWLPLLPAAPPWPAAGAASGPAHAWPTPAAPQALASPVHDWGGGASATDTQRQSQAGCQLVRQAVSAAVSASQAGCTALPCRAGLVQGNCIHAAVQLQASRRVSAQVLFCCSLTPLTPLPSQVTYLAAVLQPAGPHRWPAAASCWHCCTAPGPVSPAAPALLPSAGPCRHNPSTANTSKHLADVSGVASPALTQQAGAKDCDLHNCPRCCMHAVTL